MYFYLLCSLFVNLCQYVTLSEIMNAFVVQQSTIMLLYRQISNHCTKSKNGDEKMDWLDEVRIKAKKRNKILFSLQNPLIEAIQDLVNQHNHRTVALWAFALADETVEKLRQKYPNEDRPQNAVALSRAWAAGQVKMPVAKHAILDVHAFAKEITCLEDIAFCHAVGQACSVVHTTGHAMGFPVYDLTALVIQHGIDSCKDFVDQRVTEYFDKMAYCKTIHTDNQYTWADFMREN